MNTLQLQTRRHFFEQCSMGIGSMALATMLASEKSAHADDAALNPLTPKPPHFRPRAKNVIYLFMAGGPSQLELYDYKPKLQQLNGQPIPESYVAGKRFAFMNTSNGMNLLGARRKFAQHGDSGAWLSDALPYLGTVADDLCFVKTCKTDLFNHAPAKLFMNTGSGQWGRPSMGSWVTYGLGSECSDLPGFVVLQSGPRGPRGGAPLWGSGMLPSKFQGVPLRNQEEPIVNLTTPSAVNQVEQRKVIDLVVELNRQRLAETGDDEISTRINAYEMAYRMQTSAPALMDTSDEDAATLELYGIADPKEASFARNCLLARRLVERGVRFIQLYHTNWDSHGGVGETLEDDFPKVVKQVDQPCAALIQDLKRLGLLEDTLVIWGGEFGRTPMGENREKSGRNHHIDAFTMWFAGGGMKAGMTYGETDELGFGAATEPVHVRDIHATILHQLGLSHERLSVRAQGLDYRLTGVLPARVVTEIIT
ncbi:MAG: DUF1501 domain-containing protein [Pirellulaceae bacterium]|nr:DUF1501 domain-containing protein [Pirellulaceae bacterium]